MTVYIIAVNEEQFVEEHLPDFKETTWAYLTEYVLYWQSFRAFKTRYANIVMKLKLE